MKKIYLILIAVIICANPVMAQSEVTAQGQNVAQEDVLKNKKGVPVLPVKGNWAVGIDATPFFSYFGNMFNQNGNNFAPSFGFTAQNPGAIYVKYKKSSKTAYRGALLIGFTGETDKSTNATDPDAIDKTTQSALNIGITVGLEKNRTMFGRLVGIYGVQAGVGKTPYTDPVSGLVGKTNYKDGDNSDLDYKLVGGNTYWFSAGAFVGVEYFFAPRISLGGEFSYDLTFSSQSKRKAKPSVGDETVTDPGSTAISFAPAASGRLQLLFYF